MKMIIKKKKKKRYMVLIITSLFFSIMMALFLIYIYSSKIGPIIFSYSENEIKRLVINIINISIRDTSNKDYANGLFDIKYNDKGEIILIDFDYEKSTAVLSDVNKNIENNMKKIELGNVDMLNDYYNDTDLELLKKGIVLEVPIGVIMENKLLNNLGPKIPIKVSFTRKMDTSFSTDVVEYGINNALLKLNINIKVNVNVILPVVMNGMEINYTFPISMKVIQGNIPNYYMDGFTAKSNVIEDS